MNDFDVDNWDQWERHVDDVADAIHQDPHGWLDRQRRIIMRDDLPKWLQWMVRIS
jgi:hypothetical protein